MRHNIRVAHSDDGQAWSKELVQRVGKAIKIARGGRSAAWLSDRTAELGYRVSPTVIAKLDSGHRGSVLSVSELIVLAAALDTSPVTLVYPGPYDGRIDVLPDIETTEVQAAQWFSGVEHFSTSIVDEEGEGYEVDLDAIDEWSRNTSTLYRWRQLADAREARERAVSRATSDDIAAQANRDDIAFYDNLIQNLERLLRVGGK